MQSCICLLCYLTLFNGVYFALSVTSFLYDDLQLHQRVSVQRMLHPFLQSHSMHQEMMMIFRLFPWCLDTVGWILDCNPKFHYSEGPLALTLLTLNLTLLTITLLNLDLLTLNPTLTLTFGIVELWNSWPVLLVLWQEEHPAFIVLLQFL